MRGTCCEPWCRCSILPRKDNFLKRLWTIRNTIVDHSYGPRNARYINSGLQCLFGMLTIPSHGRIDLHTTNQRMAKARQIDKTSTCDCGRLISRQIKFRPLIRITGHSQCSQRTNYHGTRSRDGKIEPPLDHNLSCINVMVGRCCYETFQDFRTDTQDAYTDREDLGLMT
jgi:hypothetical protein